MIMASMDLLDISLVQSRYQNFALVIEDKNTRDHFQLKVLQDVVSSSKADRNLAQPKLFMRNWLQMSQALNLS
jgi:hypothetical protein